MEVHEENKITMLSWTILPGTEMLPWQQAKLNGVIKNGCHVRSVQLHHQGASHQVPQKGV
jgi:hypothetical protein